MYNNDLPNRSELPSSKQLLRSTLIAAIVASVLLVTVVLPSEYGIDPTRVGRLLGLTEMGEIKTARAAEAKKESAAATTQKAPEPSKAVSPPQSEPVQNGASAKTDVMTVTLKPGEGIEIKLEMSKDAKVNYEWAATGGTLNHDTHGDNPAKDFISYKKGTNVERDSGELVAEFDGSHGWFWRNRTAADVSVTLKTNGDYRSIKRVA